MPLPLEGPIKLVDATVANHLETQENVGRDPLLIPEQPKAYRHLEDGYTAIDVAPWAEQRQCLLTGSSCLYSKRNFNAGEVLSEFGARANMTEPNYLTVQVGETQHILLSPEWLQYINHSCAPNVSFNTTTFQLVALRSIKEGEELCFFYPSTEWSMASPFDCVCGTSVCCGRIAGASQMTYDVLRKYTLTDFINGKLSQASTP